MTGPVSFRLTADTSALRTAFARAPEIVLDELASGAVEASMLLQREIVERTPTSGAGTLRQSIQAQPVEITATRVRALVGTSLAYAIPVELGSRPHWAPIAPIREWVARRLGLSGRALDRAAHAIRAAIARRGTPAARMFERGVAETRGQVERIFEEATVRALARIDAAGGGGR